MMKQVQRNLENRIIRAEETIRSLGVLAVSEIGCCLCCCHAGGRFWRCR